MLAALALLPQLLVVDAAGGGDFTTLQAAVDAAQPGDVLLVQPGTYAPFAAAKALSILGPADGPRPVVTGESSVQGAAAFALAGLELERLRVADVPGRLELDELALGPAKVFSLELVRCDDALLQRTTVTGAVHLYSELFTLGDPAAVRAFDSHLVVVASSLVGSAGASSSGFPDECAEGAAGLRVVGGSALVVATELVGGHGGVCQTLFSFQEPGGPALVLEGASATVRGHGELLDGGLYGFGSQTAPSVVGLGGSALVASGVLLPDGSSLPGSQGWFPPQEPFVTLVGTDAPGGARRLRVYGPVGAPALLWFAPAGPPLALPGVEGLLALDPGALGFLGVVVAGGFDAPETLLLPVPPSLAGLEGAAVSFQGAFPTVPGAVVPWALLATNPTSAVLRF